MTVGNNLLAKFIAPVNYSIITLTFLKVYNVALNRWVILLLFMSAILFVFVIGFVYDRLGLYSVEITFDNKRNKLLVDALERIEVVTSHLEELKHTNSLLMEKLDSIQSQTDSGFSGSRVAQDITTAYSTSSKTDGRAPASANQTGD